MLIRKGYRFALKTNRREERLLRSFAGCSRFVWNKALAIQKERLDAKKNVLKYEELAGALAEEPSEPLAPLDADLRTPAGAVASRAAVEQAPAL